MEELLPTFLPVLVYWITSGIYHIMVDSKEYRLFTEEEEEEQNIVPPKEVLRGVLANQAMQMVLAIFYFSILRGERKTRGGFVQITGQIAIALLVIDAWEYFWHRLTHENHFLFKHVHAMHHYQLVPYAYGAQYLNLVDAFMGQLLGSVVSVELSGMSKTTSAVFFCVLAVKVVDDHCSRWFPGVNPFHRYFLNNVAFHGLHHQLHGLKFNYSIHFLATWDVLLGTYLPFTVEKKKEGGYRIHALND
ncbi:sphinganine C4-monooxygenase 1-like [Wolffia australiana]